METKHEPIDYTNFDGLPIRRFHEIGGMMSMRQIHRMVEDGEATVEDLEKQQAKHRKAMMGHAEAHDEIEELKEELRS